ncbi:MAG TPA: TonB family protein [Bacteroidia bacterium]|nr:TonB family protein [Bacteroidia bacterium]
MEKNSRFIPDWNNVLSDGRNEMVFDGRNKEYGAYVIRRAYNRIVIKALIIAVSAIIVLVGIPIIVRLIEGVNLHANEGLKGVVIVLPPPPPVDPNKVTPPPPPPPPPPVMKTIQFTPPVVKPDEKVVDPPPSQIDLQKTQAGAKTQDGKDTNLLAPINTGTGIAPAAPQKPFLIVQQMPTFPGGEAKLFEYLQNNTNYPQVEKEEGVQGTVYVTFVIGSDGKVQDVKIMRGIPNGPGCNKEAVRVVQAMPNWTPGKQDGRSVPVQYSLPIKFILR